MTDKSGSHPLASVLTPDFLASVTKARLPPNKGGKHDLSNVWNFLPDFESDGTRSAWWSALVAISKIPLSEVPDMMSFLPSPTDASFPEQCLGLTLLVDQGPRLLCRGLDGRWTDTFFGVIARQLAHSWLALPAEQRPNAWARWKNAGASLEYWILVHFFLSCPFVHSEILDDQNVGLDLTEERRKVVEDLSGRTDLYRSKRTDVLSDVFAFSRVARAGSPVGEDVTTQEWVFWSCMLMDVHWPIIRRFGRYPYRNLILGRQSTEEELEWLKETEHFGEASAEVAVKVKEDIAADRWTSLSREPMFN
ncbi:hypothetical protein ColLi_08329 [Colletotrichum liriopes]|uniref:Uncharacterized protein n=1 Tax=Colletotrichum liriopes TaxID=708192 RepID=A0AA37GS94_9PEZI|nr:hypothetical protein ColLi_08329 [Colletotrichum liriopes]